MSRILALTKKAVIILSRLGINVRVIASYRHLLKYLLQRKRWVQLGGKITKTYMVLTDYGDGAGTAKGHYFHQDLLVAKFIHEHQPTRHLDVGSRIDGFVAHVASFREVEVLDIRPLTPSEHQNIIFKQADLMESQAIGLSDSVSCLHAIEHFGLGRYSDELDPMGHEKGLENLINLVEERGRLYIGVPIGEKDEVHFNAHRVFHPQSLPNLPCIQRNMKLVRFDYVRDDGSLIQDVSPREAVGSVTYGCGIYTFQKLELNSL